MKSVMSPVVLDCPVSSPLPAAICRCFQTCRCVLADVAESFMCGLNRKSLPAVEQEDDFDWRVHEFIYEKEYLHTLPRRAWRRHSAMLVMARELEMQSDVAISHEASVMRDQHGAM